VPGKNNHRHTDGNDHYGHDRQDEIQQLLVLEGLDGESLLAIAAARRRAPGVVQVIHFG